MSTRKRAKESAESETRVEDPPVEPRRNFIEPEPKKPEPKPEPKPVVEAPTPKPAVSPRNKVERLRALPRITLDVFLLASGKRADQSAGFRRWAKRNTVKRQTMPEWEKLWETFLQRPM